ncbi:MAG: RsmB/NOP family class I SAM-dependent RNA methyltransferase [Spirochaetaceae bacterium]|nr:MAG: RsmB/NOP family class I SAM-dependent RNA methyltransferase [Spirochaetaceae bacterium]
MSHQDQKRQIEYSQNDTTPSDIESQQRPGASVPASPAHGRQAVAQGKGPKGFEYHYAEIFADRWPKLSEALQQDGVHEELGQPLCRSYFLDPASAEAAGALDIQPGMRVLDMCAAPGGKAVAMLHKFLKNYPHGEIDLTLNERSASRRARLQRVLNDSVPSWSRSAIRVTSHDARKWGLHEQNMYDVILLDTPCSSERHLIQEPKTLRNWNPKRSMRLALDAYAMLAAALTALRPGGTVLYLTCALSPLENDGVIAKAIQRRGSEFEVLPAPPLSDAEPSRHGCIVLPDHAGGRGPLFAALLRKHRVDTS